MNKMLSEDKYNKISNFFFRELPQKTCICPLRLCSLHEKYVLGSLGKEELAKIIDDNPKGGKK